MLYICIFSNKLDLNQAIRVSHINNKLFELDFEAFNVNLLLLGIFEVGKEVTWLDEEVGVKLNDSRVVV